MWRGQVTQRGRRERATPGQRASASGTGVQLGAIPGVLAVQLARLEPSPPAQGPAGAPPSLCRCRSALLDSHVRRPDLGARAGLPVLVPCVRPDGGPPPLGFRMCPELYWKVTAEVCGLALRHCEI